MKQSLQLSYSSGFHIEMQIILRLLSSLQKPYSNASSSSAIRKKLMSAHFTMLMFLFSTLRYETCC